MKKITIIVRILLLSAVLFWSQSCMKDFEQINRNPNEATKDQLEWENYLIGTNLKLLQSLVIPVEEHLYQFNESLTGNPFAGYMGETPDGWKDKYSTFNPSADWLKWPFVNVIPDSYAGYRGVVNTTDDEVAVALAKLLHVAIMHRLVDCYGPIPYSKLLDDKTEAFTQSYDTQEEAYMKMFDVLDEALAVLHDNTQLSAEAFRKFDNVYYGNLTQWIKYTNSLKMRMAMRLSYIKPDLAKSKAAEALADGVIESNADNAAMHAPENRLTLIYNDWGDHRVGADILNYMNGYKDPRREKMFTQTMGGSKDEKKKGYYGIRIGIDTESKAKCVEAYSNMIVTSTTPYLWMNAAEITFLRAEYELRWGSADAAQSLYEAAVKLSFEERGATGADTYLKDKVSIPTSYTDPLDLHSSDTPQGTITIAWETNPGEDVKERNLERIITQKWIAIFPLGTEAWSEYRRTGYPRLLPAVVNKSGGTVDSRYGFRRIPYPIEEYNENPINLQQAIVKLGGPDNGGTRVWWDVKPYNK